MSTLKATRVKCPTCGRDKRLACMTKNGYFSLKTHMSREKLAEERDREASVFQIESWSTAFPAVPTGNLIVGEPTTDPHTGWVRLVYDITSDTEMDYPIPAHCLKFVDYATDYLGRNKNAN